jgi:hypothetical protein
MAFLLRMVDEATSASLTSTTTTTTTPTPTTATTTTITTSTRVVIANYQHARQAMIYVTLADFLTLDDADSEKLMACSCAVVQQQYYNNNIQLLSYLGSVL